MNRATPRLIDVTICDEVRREESGKLLVIGMYLGNVLVRAFPSTIPSLTFICKWRTPSGALPAAEYAVVGPGRRKVASLHTEASPSDASVPVSMIVCCFRPFTFDGPGRFRLACKFGKQRSRTIAEFDVAVATPAGSL